MLIIAPSFFARQSGRQTWRRYSGVALLMLAGGVYAVETNLLENPGFEMANPKATNSPAGYGTYIRAAGGSNTDRMCQWVATGRTGKGFKSETTGAYAVLRHEPKPVLESNTLYRYSFWYRTESDRPVADIIPLNAGNSFPYHTAPEWVQAHIWFLGKEGGQLEACVAGFQDGRPEYKMGANDKPLKDENGKPFVLNPVKITAWIDDCELRQVQASDYDGNLLKNGDFENGRAPHMAQDWRNMYNPGRRVGALDDRVFLAGKQSLRVDCTNVICLAANRVPVRPGDICTFSFAIKSTAASLPIRVDVATNGKKNYANDNWIQQKHFVAGTEWRKLDFMIAIPDKDSADYDPDTAVAQCMIRIEAPATIWLDDAALVVEKF